MILKTYDFKKSGDTREVANCAEVKLVKVDGGKIGTIVIGDIFRAKIPFRTLSLDSTAKTDNLILKYELSGCGVYNASGTKITTVKSSPFYLVPGKGSTVEIYV